MNLDAGEQRSEEFLKINPLGAIPALVEPGHASLTQSLAILESSVRQKNLWASFGSGSLPST